MLDLMVFGIEAAEKCQFLIGNVSTQQVVPNPAMGFVNNVSIPHRQCIYCRLCGTNI